MANPVVASGVKFVREKGFLYFVDREGDVSRVPRSIGHYPGPTGRKQKVVKVGLKKQPGLWYYLEKDKIRAVRPRKGRRTAEQ